MLKCLLLSSLLVFPEIYARELTAANRDDAVIRRIDSLIGATLKEKRVSPGKLISDEAFLRRAFLDIAGRIPTLQEYERFMSSKATNKRHQLIDKLFDSPGYVSNSHNYWMDVLRLRTKSRKTENYSYKLWLRKAIQSNMPYDQFVKNLVGSQGLYHEPGAGGATGYYMRDYQMNMEIVSNTMQIFLGTSMICAQCHDHPYKKWTQMDYYKLAAFIEGTIINSTIENTDAKEAVKKAKSIKGNMSKKEVNSVRDAFIPMYEGVFRGGSGTIHLPADYDYDDAKPHDLVKAGVPFGPPVKIDYDQTVSPKKYNIKRIDRNKATDVNARLHLANWITAAENPMFTKTIVNRLWDRVFGLPLVGDLLDMKENQMGQNPRLTALLIKFMKSVNYDQKRFMKALYKTTAYQREAIDDNKTKYYYQAPVIKRLSAEKIWDSLLTIRQEDPDVDLLKGSLNSSNILYNEMFKRNLKERIEFSLNTKASMEKAIEGKDIIPRIRLVWNNKRASLYRSPRGVGSFLDIYGQSERETIDGAVREATIPQALHLMNDPTYTRIQRYSLLYKKLKDSSHMSREEQITLIYQAILSRRPSPAEIRGILTFFQKEKSFNTDLIWALTNSNEFKMRP